MRAKTLISTLFLAFLTIPAAGAAATRIEQITTTDAEVAAARARNPRDGRVIEYDLRTQVLRRLEAPTLPENHGFELLPGRGDWESDDASSFKDMSGYVKITDPTQGIFPKHVKLRMIWNVIGVGPDSTDCSGTLIGPYHVLTAGHCAFSAQDPTRTLQAMAISVRPGWSAAGMGPAGFANVVTMRSFTGWTDEGDYDDDIALLTLDRPVGALVGWRGANATSNWDYFDNLTWQSWSYPADNRDPNDPPLSGNDMYYQLGDFDYDDAPLYGWNRPGYGGTSGGGSIKDGQVWSVHSHTRTWSNGDVDSYDAALTSSKWTAIYTWIGDDEPDWPDLTPLDTTCENSSAIAGGQFGAISFLVHNRGAVDKTGALYTIRIGTTRDTKATDTYVFDAYEPGIIPARGSKRITLNNLVVPPELTEGLYYIGIDLDPSDVVPGNDLTGPQDTVAFSVTCADQVAPQPVFPVDGHPCVGSDITLDWGSVPGVGMQYKVWLYKSEGGWGVTEITSSTQHTFYGLDEDQTYYWRVAARPPCGGQSQWSDEFSFHVTGILNSLPFLDPAPSQTCVGSSVTVNWDTTEWADLYRIRVENQTTSTVDYYDVAAPPLVVTGLLPNSQYQLRLQWRNACLDWSRRSHVEFTTVANGVPNEPVLVTPIGGNYTGIDTTLEVVYEPATASVEYEVKNSNDDVIVSAASNYQLEVPGLSGGLYTWRARQEACTSTGTAWSQWSQWQSFEVDDSIPIMMYPPDPISPPVGTWVNIEMITVEFYPATDNCCVAEYWVSFDEDPAGVPDGSTVLSQAGPYEQLIDQGQWWFHVVAVDGNGNVSEPQHLGPFLIDFAPPEAPEPVANIEPLTYSNVDKIDVTWPPAVDAGSGVAGYSFAWSTSPSYVLDDIIDTTGLAATLDPAPEGSRYFYLRAIDALGQAGPVVSQRYFVDRTGPTFNYFDPDDWMNLQYGSVIQTFFPLNDLCAPRDIELHHFYSVDGGSFWYNAVCGGALCQTSPLCGATNSQTCNVSVGNDPYYWRVPWVPPGSQVLYKVIAVDCAGNSSERIGAQPFTVSGITTDTPEVHDFALLGNAPNPFNPRTTIRYALASESAVTLDIFDLSGRRVLRLVDELQSGPRAYAVDWDGRDAAGRSVSSGVYLYRLRAGDYVETKRMALLK